MSASERLVEVLIAIEIEAAEFYEALARRPGERPELRALWVDLAEDERQHANWLRRLGGGALASERLTEVAAPSLEAALAAVRRHRQRIEHGGASDTGPGISPADLPHLFEPFYTTKPAGTGLGLAVSYGIVQDHEGTIEARSAHGQGATFTLTFPALERT